MKSRLLGAVGACVITYSSVPAHAVGVSGQGTWQTTLEARDLDGNTLTVEAYYDTVLDITWLADANLAESITFGVTGLGPNGSIVWDKATEWFMAMNASNSGQGYLDINTWRLASNTPLNGVSYDPTFTSDGSTDNAYNISAPNSTFEFSTASEMAHLYYVTLENIGGQDLNGNSNLCVETYNTCVNNTGPFHNLEVQANYWSGSYNSATAEMQWNFFFQNGQQYELTKSHENYLWAVADGDNGVAVIPIPPALYLFGFGLMGLLGISRRRRDLPARNSGI